MEITQANFDKIVAENSDLRNKILFLDKELTYLGSRLSALEEKRRSRDKSTFNWAVALENMKQDFLRSEPNQRHDSFSDFELVFWYSYVVSQTPYPEKLTTYAELTKRVSKVKAVIKYYIENSPDGIPEDKEAWARIRTKQFLEYMALAVGSYDTKSGEKKHINFYIACSDWAMNNYGHLVGSWQKLKNLDDKPL